MKRLLFWTGIKSTDDFLVNRHSTYEWMDYSRKTWEYWCNKHDIDFYAYETPSESDTLKHRPNWQRWFDMIKFFDEYDQILSTDASIMVKWDTPNLFEQTDNKLCVLPSRENFKWVYESATGYEPMFPTIEFDYKRYFNSGFMLLNKSHKPLLEKLRDFYWENVNEINRYQTELVKRGTDQPVFNFIVQDSDIDVKMLPIKFGINHLYRWDVLRNNWQLNEDPTPFFIKYFYVWIFSGFSDRGETRTNLMKQTWDLVKNNYK